MVVGRHYDRSRKDGAGLLYDANYDETLIAARTRCKDLYHAFNQLLSSQVAEQEALIRDLFGKTGSSFCVTAPFWCDYGSNIEIGENFYTNYNCVILDGVRVRFGDNVVIGAGSIVNRDIPSGVVAVGNPCRVLRPITEADKEKYRVPPACL